MERRGGSVWWLVVLAGCQTGDDAAPAPAPPASAPPLVSATASATVATHPRAGDWGCHFEAARASVTVPAGVPYRSWEADDGSGATGPGEIAVTVDGDGQVAGSARGALGEMRLRGAIEDSELRAGLTPAGGEEPGMRGTLLGLASGDGMALELRVSSSDGSVVRAASCALKRR